MSAQSAMGSLVESAAGTAFGFVISWAATPPILGLFGYHAGAGQAAGIVAIYTAISFVRGYVVRRVFNRWHVRRVSA